MFGFSIIKNWVPSVWLTEESEKLFLSLRKRAIYKISSEENMLYYKGHGLFLNGLK